MAEKLPVHLDLKSHELPKTDVIPGLNRMTVTVEDLTYLGRHLCTISIIGFNSSTGVREKICYEDFLPKNSPSHPSPNFIRFG